ncbi:MAG: prolyl-tRNA synthetase associated domain-containing protein [Rhodospirillales bacterium]|nr:prolyl-tRNA synthetase associated domain-containing protein [Rhodospirillales bacterium]
MPATRQELLTRFDAQGIETQTVDHAAVFTVEESRHLHAAIPGAHSKNLFLKDAKDALWLVVAEADRPIDLKALPAAIGSKRLSFGSAALLTEVLGIPPGSVTPFALINDTARRVNVVLDAEMMAKTPLNFHPLENTATTSISPDGLRRFLASTGHVAREVKLPERG